MPTNCSTIRLVSQGSVRAGEIVAETGRRALLRVEGLRIAFGGSEAVRGVSFAIAPGETLGLVGESGSGKSVTSLAALRLLPPEARVSGRIWFAEQEDLTPTSQNRDPSTGSGQAVGHTASVAQVDLLALPEREMRARRGREIAMIFQEPMTALNPVMRVGEQIAEAVRAHHPGLGRMEVRERVLEAMREVALPEPERRWRDYPHQFSGGQRQRILIAMALVNRPRLLIADEPTTALDVTVQAQVLELLRRLRETHGLSLLFISHDLAVVAQACDRPGDHIAVMRQGEIVEYAEARELFARPQHEYTRKLLASAPTMRTDRMRPLASMAEKR